MGNIESILNSLTEDELEELYKLRKAEQEENERYLREEVYIDDEEEYTSGYYETEDGELVHDNNLEDIDRINKDIKKTSTLLVEKQKLYNKDDIAKDFDSKQFDYFFKNYYGNIEKRDFKIYHFLKHHLSHKKIDYIKNCFDKEIDAIKTFFDIEEIKYIYDSAEYHIPFIETSKNYADTYECLKVYISKLLKLLSEYGIRIHHTPFLFKSDYHLTHLNKTIEPIKELYDKISFTKSSNYFDIFSNIIVSDNNPEYKKAVSLVFYHWMWRIKYKIQKFLEIESKLKDNYDSYYPIAPVLYGAQGAGKSMLIDKLLNVLKDTGLTTSTQTHSLFEGYTYDLPSKYFVISLDDLATIKDDNVPVFKDLVSGESRTGRQKGDVSSRKFITRASFILGSNIPVSDVIQDETGNRRFFQVNVKKFAHEIKDRNFIALWKSVDENSPPISKEDWTRYVEPFQKVNKTKSKLEQFIDDSNLHLVDVETYKQNSENYQILSTSTLYDVYKTWSGGYALDRSKTMNSINRHFNVSANVIKHEGKVLRVYYMAKDYSYDFEMLLRKHKLKK